MRIIAITVVSLIFIGILVLMARIWGLGQNYPLYESPFFSKTSSPMIVVKVTTLKAAEEAVNQQPEAILWLDVRYSRDKVVFVLPPLRDREFLEKKRKDQELNPATPIFTGGRLSEYSWEQIQAHFKEATQLSTYYKKFPQSRFVLNIIDNVSEAHLALIEEIKELKPKERTLIQSDALVIMTSIRELKPEWAYGTSTPDIMRLLTFDSMLVLPSTQFKGDVFIAPFTIMKRPAFNADIISEIRRRNKRIILGPIQNETQFAEASRLKVEGYLTEDLPLLLRLLSQELKQ